MPRATMKTMQTELESLRHNLELMRIENAALAEKLASAQEANRDASRTPVVPEASDPHALAKAYAMQNKVLTRVTNGVVEARTPDGWKVVSNS